MTFANRTEAGRSLATKLEPWKSQEGLLVLGMARGGVVVAYELAKALHAPLDVLIVRKLGIPGHEEMAFGAIASGGARVIDQDTVRSACISELEVELISAAEFQELQRREQAYRGYRMPLEIRGSNVILVDDGIATGESIEAACLAVRKQNPATLTAAVPVAPAATDRRLAGKVDNLIVLEVPGSFSAVSQFYEDFCEVDDLTVRDLLRRGARNVATGTPRPK